MNYRGRNPLQIYSNPTGRPTLREPKRKNRRLNRSPRRCPANRPYRRKRLYGRAITPSPAFTLPPLVPRRVQHISRAVRSIISCRCCGVTSFTRRAGTPAYTPPGSSRLPASTSALAATIQPSRPRRCRAPWPPCYQAPVFDDGTVDDGVVPMETSLPICACDGCGAPS